MKINNTERAIDKLAKYCIYAVFIYIAYFLCNYFLNLITYIIIAAVIALIAKPIMTSLRKLRIRKKQIPDFILALFTEIVLFIILIAVITQIFPIAYKLIINAINIIQQDNNPLTLSQLSIPIDRINHWIIDTFPNINENFNIRYEAIEYFKEAFTIGSISSLLGSITHSLINLSVGLFSVLFISFFFIKDEKLFNKIISGIMPEQYEEKTILTISKIEKLLSRYFSGLMLEITIVSICNFIGLYFIADLNLYSSIGIAFITGLLNIVPYLGPLIGGLIGLTLGTILKISIISAIGITSTSLLYTVLLLLGIFAATQMIDNFLLQPIIYSKSIKANALEIFIVLIIAAKIHGVIGMLIAIPSYTVIRAIASVFFKDFKITQKLIHEDDTK